MLRFTFLILVFTQSKICGNRGASSTTTTTITTTSTSNIEVHFFHQTRRDKYLFIQLDGRTADKSIEIIKGRNASLDSYNVTKPTIFLIPGYLGAIDFGMNTPAAILKKTLLNSYDVNVIVVDWDRNLTLPYAEAVPKVPEIGKEIASLIDWMVTMGGSLSTIHLVGYSLGAQIAGSAGRQVKAGKIAHITGLDPASSHFEDTPECLNKDDAAYVEVIHTDCGHLGVCSPCGHNDFYPNGGNQMPGCGLVDPICCHLRAVDFYIESLAYPTSFLSNLCMSTEDVAYGLCSKDQTLHMGGVEVKPALGLFYLQTKADYPYSLS